MLYACKVEKVYVDLLGPDSSRLKYNTEFRLWNIIRKYESAPHFEINGRFSMIFAQIKQTSNMKIHGGLPKLVASNLRLQYYPNLLSEIWKIM